MTVIGIEFDSTESLQDALRIARHEFDVRNEDFLHCVSRERGLEVLACRDMGIPYLVYERGTGSVIDRNVDLDNLPEGAQLMVRSASDYRPSIDGLELMPNKDEAVSRWPEHMVNPETYLRRNVSLVPHSEFASVVKQGVLSLPCFVKTLDKGKLMTASLHHVIDESNIHLFNFDQDKKMMFDHHDAQSEISFLFEGKEYYNDFLGEMYRSHDMNHSLHGDFIVSDVMAIDHDDLGDKGTVEYRFFIVNDKVVNGSRYTDYDSLPVSQKAIVFAAHFARDHAGTFGPAYVVDVAETDKGFQVIELNPFAASGRYLDNCPKELYQAIYEAFGGPDATREPLVAIPEPNTDRAEFGFGPALFD